MQTKYVEVSYWVDKDEGEIEVFVDGLVHYSVDHNYGEDADGNRGCEMTFIEDITEIDSGYAYNEYGDEYEVTFTSKERSEVEELVSSKFIN